MIAATERKPIPTRFYPLPRCPFCNHHKMKVRKTVQQGDESVMRYVTCIRCNKNSSYVLE